MNEHIASQLFHGPPAPPSTYYHALPLQKKTPHVYSRAEQILAATAVLIGFLNQFFLFDFRSAYSSFFSFLPFFIAFAVLNRRVLTENRVLLAATALSFLLSCTVLANPYQEFLYLNTLLMPCLLLALGRYAQGNYGSKQALDYIAQTFFGLIFDWYSAAHRLPLSIAALRKKDSERWKPVCAGLALGGGMLMILLPLMLTADSVFSHFIYTFSEHLGLHSFDSLSFRLFYGGLISFGSYSLLWNSRFRPYQPLVKERPKLPFNPTVVGVSFGVVLAVYALFCGVQFAYLFAGAALPQGLTYSQYAVSGFWELVQIACVNLALFALTAEYGPENKLFFGLKLGLLAATGVMLASAILRLNLYIQAYSGMTWLRLLAMWFLIYMAAVLALCVVRLFAEGFPVVTVAALVLLGWWVVLGFAGGWIDRQWPQINQYLNSWFF